MAAVVSSDARVSGDADDTAAGDSAGTAANAQSAAAGADDVPVSEAEKTRQEEPVQSNQISEDVPRKHNQDADLPDRRGKTADG